MSVVSVDEISDGRDGEDNEEWVSDYTRVFRVCTDDDTDGSRTVMDADGIPSRYDAYENLAGESDPSTIAMKISAQQDQEDPRTWLVTVHYSTMRLTGEAAAMAMAGQGDPDPTLRPTRFYVDECRYTKAVTHDVNGNPICSSAGQFFKGVEVDDVRTVYVFIRNERTVDLGTILKFNNKINSQYWLGIDVHCGKMTIKPSEILFEGKIPFFQVTYRIEINEITWDRWFQDSGTYYLDKSGSPWRIVRPKATDAGVVGGQIFLDGNGGFLPPQAEGISLKTYWLPPGSAVDEPPDEDGNGGFQMYEERDFNELELTPPAI